mmetsp:Transcript_22550/g.57230  ORF Transcript_22550/g.57230 Transcript_22550/m.57230 type:complete len:241 (+) Transcript_22550:210-932(+)
MWRRIGSHADRRPRMRCRGPQQRRIPSTSLPPTSEKILPRLSSPVYIWLVRQLVLPYVQPKAKFSTKTEHSSASAAPGLANPPLPNRPSSAAAPTSAGLGGCPSRSIAGSIPWSAPPPERARPTARSITKTVVLPKPMTSSERRQSPSSASAMLCAIRIERCAFASDEAGAARAAECNEAKGGAVEDTGLAAGALGAAAVERGRAAGGAEEEACTQLFSRASRSAASVLSDSLSIEGPEG